MEYVQEQLENEKAVNDALSTDNMRLKKENIVLARTVEILEDKLERAESRADRDLGLALYQAFCEVLGSLERRLATGPYPPEVLDAARVDLGKLYTILDAMEALNGTGGTEVKDN